jgi:hypothetical protein
MRRKPTCAEGLTETNDDLVVLSDLRAGDCQIDSIQVRQAKGVGATAPCAGGPDEESLMD